MSTDRLLATNNRLLARLIYVTTQAAREGGYWPDDGSALQTEADILAQAEGRPEPVACRALQYRALECGAAKCGVPTRSPSPAALPAWTSPAVAGAVNSHP